mmetsp:Transcript_8882/g.12280  ORF Transcript_8882/g.12280 Transcript_8882/m.12280 type:complete len:254 (-) Transcript_8882:69-830(-)|eukprot:CAMPEP_0185724050 /NCGR_PEP_ID=MMETSP1171-20130828/658_1 /TAXON_ID=374046 /ORGANISM="Helicotheca tamensis, Strain CCMP826" /LENGTH=253 /DNA_ID=CAMNT_0028391825 /DNA_START=48 /DNA_END=809 /DNA_ORIENTATION=+
MTKRTITALLALFLVLPANPASSFIIPSPCKSSPFCSQCVSLHAKKSGGKKKKSSAGGGGGGFGASAAKEDNKVRSVSGYTGSGTKPLRVAANTFDALRQQYGKECTTDVYVRSPKNDAQICWFVGKVARQLDLSNCQGASIPTETEAVISQKRLILEYAKNQLRPQNLGGPYSSNLELWMAPGDSEMDVVQNKISFDRVLGSTKADISDTFHVADVGFNPEIYVGDEVKDGGLRVLRDEEGRPVKPVFEVNQ